MGTNLQRIASGIDVGPLLAALDSKPYLWKEITERQTTPGTYHQDTESVFLRWAQSRSIQAVFTEIPVVDYPALEELPEARELIGLIAGILGTDQIGRVILAKLKVGGYIAPHIDEGDYADHYERFHLVVLSEEGNLFLVGVPDLEGEFAKMKPSELWWFNHKEPHWVTNLSEAPRIHMIVDAVVPQYRRERVHAVSA